MGLPTEEEKRVWELTGKAIEVRIQADQMRA